MQAHEEQLTDDKLAFLEGMMTCKKIMNKTWKKYDINSKEQEQRCQVH